MGQPLVCLVDDEKDITDAFASSLKSHFEVRAFNSATDALEAMDHGFTPDVLVSDLRMPKMDGLSFLSKLRERNLKSKVIVASGQADKSDVLKALNLGVFGFLEKPFRNSELLDMIEHASSNGGLSATDVIDDIFRLDKILNDTDQLSQSYYLRLTTLETVALESNITLFHSPDELYEYAKALSNERLLIKSIEIERNNLRYHLLKSKYKSTS